ncbi:MAG: hypothetical protein RL220_26 [Bacteroidota bacterium]|jgi:hypothetical protein
MKTFLTHLFIATFLLTLATEVTGQSIERSVISSYGILVDSGPVRMSATMGEIAVATGYGDGLILTQGFQQPPALSITCLGDFDNSGYINVADLLIFFGSFGCQADCGLTDMDNSGSVTVADLLFFFSVFGTSCP